MATAPALASLRSVLGDGPSDQDLIALLSRAQYSVATAVNLFYEPPPATPAATNKRPAPAASHPAKQLRLASRDYGSEKKPSIPQGAQPPDEHTQPAAVQQAATAPAEGIRPAAVLRGAKPLAERMRPSTLEDLVGQSDALDRVIRQAVAADRLPSLILWGPPGCGKTSFAACVARSTRQIFRSISAARVGVSELRDELARAANAQRLRGDRTILFVDEVHRWSKAQQDALLHDCEKGTVTLIGATTENPSFSLNNAILSRCRLVVFSKLPPDALQRVVRRACDTDPALKGVTLTDDAVKALVAAADGDARVALNVLELAASAGAQEVGPEAVLAAAQRRSLYDRDGDFHYDLISALHKAMRGGDVDAALYYVARMLHGGEEPRYITRRLIRFASEDVGLAEPAALQQAVAADQAVHAIGMPEAGVVIAQAAAYLALAPKSCAVYSAFKAAMEACEKEPHAAVPLHLRNAPTKAMKGLGYGKGYVYNPSDGYGRGCEQGYLPQELGPHRRFWDPTDCEPGHTLKFCEPR